ncbi:alpha/beta fold hydrolase [Gracilibacillus oryzae]|uniref:Alpha/beta fold hydrolase n=1 Tax=Gracilibacillus oryzae TaxID=1672701 RepID=A0A7C8GUG0_9BACI|nr:alpha/beta fold hydrolase [Gracilibacillus oryzae]KAB8137963.1 alpha/beta fold hydrolase [Gracilibacillus oryzae]
MSGCLVLHGFTGGPYEVLPLAEHLESATEWEIVTPSLPGHGLGSGRDLDLTAVTYQDWIDACEKAYKDLQERHETIYIIGFSMGGMISAYLAAKYGCAKLVLLSTSRRYISIPRMTMDILNFGQKALKRKLKSDPLYQHYMTKYGSVPVRATMEFLKCMKFTKPYLKEITCPVFIAQGIQDGMVPYKAVHYLDKEIPVDAQIIYFHDSKHLICLGEDKDVVIKAVYQFLIESPDETALAENG